MDILKKFQDAIKNFDFNSMMTTVISTIGAVNTEDITQSVFLLMTVATTFLQLINTYKKNVRENKLLELDYKQKEAEIHSIIIENRKAEMDIIK